jgi:hypothetical protein
MNATTVPPSLKTGSCGCPCDSCVNEDHAGCLIPH